MSKVDLIEEDLWDHYSGLPNPSWYQYKKKSTDEKADTNNSTDLGNSKETPQLQTEKHMGFINANQLKQNE